MCVVLGGYGRRVRFLTLIDPRGLRLDVEVPQSRADRRRGLLGRSELGEGAGMLFLHCRSVHTIGMRFPILVVWLDADVRVLDARRVRPGRICRPRFRARHVLECSPVASLRGGDRLRRCFVRLARPG